MGGGENDELTPPGAPEPERAGPWPAQGTGPAWGYGPPWQPPHPPPPSQRSGSADAWILGGVIAAVLAAAIVVGIGVALVVNSDAPTDRREAVGGAAQPEDDDVVWERTGRRDTYGVATNGEIACTTGGRELLCVDVDSGIEVFSDQLPDAGVPPVLVGETLVVAADAGHGEGDLRGYSPDGELLWQSTELSDTFLQDAALGLFPEIPAAGGVVAVPTNDGVEDTVAGIDVRSGEELWRAVDPASGWTNPVGPVVSDGQRFYVTSLVFDPADIVGEPGTVVSALDRTTGRELWRVELAPEELAVEAASVTDDGAVALTIGGNPSRLVVLDAATGATRWEVASAGEWLTAAHLDGVTVVADGVDLRGFDAGGTEVWSYENPGGVRPADPFPPDLAVSGGRMFAHRIHLYEIEVGGAGGFDRFGPTTMVEDLAVAGDLLLVAGDGLIAVRLPD